MVHVVGVLAILLDDRVWQQVVFNPSLNQDTSAHPHQLLKRDGVSTARPEAQAARVQRNGRGGIPVVVVAANQLLRDRLTAELDIPVHMPPMALCVDNGAMIAAAAHSRLEHGYTGGLDATPTPNLPL